MELILKYFPNLTQEQIKQFTLLMELYKDWNNKINVVSRKDIDELYLRHVLHSLSIAKIIQFNAGSKIMDVGTGGGFPGIPLAIMFPESSFLLVDSIAKKIHVVNAVTSTLQLQNVKTAHTRVEAVNNTFDFIVSRAVTDMQVFVNWTKNKIVKEQNNTLKNGILSLKGGDLTEELKPYKTVTCYNLKNYYDEDFFETKKLVHLPIKFKGTKH